MAPLLAQGSHRKVIVSLQAAFLSYFLPGPTPKQPVRPSTGWNGGSESVLQLCERDPILTKKHEPSELPGIKKLTDPLI